MAKETKQKNSTLRTRNWTSILYPESAAANWLEILKEQHINFLVSPLHDKDISANGEPKKPHYHIILLFNSVKTHEQAQKVFNLIGAIDCREVQDIKAIARYLCHLDDYNKAQYDTKDVISYGLDYNDIIKNNADEWTNLATIEQIIEEENFYSYAKLSSYLRATNTELYKTLCTHTYHLSAILKSRTWENQQIDPNTGEVKI